METKICIKCGIEKSKDDFYMGRNGKIRNSCKSCLNKMVRENDKKHYCEKKEKHALFITNNVNATKKCSICKQILSVRNFPFHSTKADLMSNECRSCRSKLTKKRAFKNQKLLFMADRTSTKICRICGQEKRLIDFNIHLTTKDLHRNECIECQKINSKNHYLTLDKEKESKKRRLWYENNPTISHNSHLKRNFNISHDEYLALLEKQKGRCAICGSDKPKGKYTHFTVDHDHETGKIRGLLCSSCNTGIGHMQDSALLLRKAADYLESLNN